MKKEAWFTLLALIMGFSQTGCSTLLGAGAGAAGTAAAYEVHSKSELDQLKKDFDSGKISKADYEARKRQVEKGSLVY